jgi:hypothetical protein
MYTPDPVRPANFPEVLVAPEGALLIDHATPAESRSAPDTYSLGFEIRDPYPSEKTRTFVETHLTEKGWQRLDYQLLNPDVPREYGHPLLYKLYSDSNNLDKYPRKDPLLFKDDWVSKEGQHIGVMAYYYVNLKTKDVDYNRLFVNMSLFGRQSWVYPRILEYKRLHPEEFEDPNEQPSAGTGGEENQRQ